MEEQSVLPPPPPPATILGPENCRLPPLTSADKTQRKAKSPARHRRRAGRTCARGGARRGQRARGAGGAAPGESAMAMALLFRGSGVWKQNAPPGQCRGQGEPPLPRPLASRGRPGSRSTSANNNRNNSNNKSAQLASSGIRGRAAGAAVTFLRPARGRGSAGNEGGGRRDARSAAGPAAGAAGAEGCCGCGVRGAEEEGGAAGRWAGGCARAEGAQPGGSGPPRCRAAG